ncbi:hypothetical protein EV651_11181 [Kribbella sp. VKM Ac-2571]|uniref:hypothetical protein n=1 Tax=Kribbella sp. VKM Ac-2571 TaxID=2512222 RepID=UPI0010F13FF4|nr:hypothetical protein [Kribbella sp. VKM Ac-2571]TDO57357.1 hypothetical protein EV651_11181 [Kribbella sp. VKM Ac-2571]
MLVSIFGLTGLGGWLTVMIDAHFKNQLYTDKLAEQDLLAAGPGVLSLGRPDARVGGS